MFCSVIDVKKNESFKLKELDDLQNICKFQISFFQAIHYQNINTPPPFYMILKLFCRNLTFLKDLNSLESITII